MTFLRILCLTLALFSSAQAQSPVLPGPGLPVAAASPPVVTYVSQASGSVVGNTITATINGGNPAYISTRRILLVIAGTGAGANITGGTINGVSLDQFTNLGVCGGIDCVDFVSAPVPSGTTGLAVTINYSASPFNGPNITVYNADNSLMSSATPTTGATENTGGAGTNTTTVNTTTKAGGFILAGDWCGGGAGPSITASTETYTTDYSVSSYMSAHANSITSNASNSVSTQCPPAGGNSLLGLAAYR